MTAFRLLDREPASTKNEKKAHEKMRHDPKGVAREGRDGTEKIKQKSQRLVSSAGHEGKSSIPCRVESGMTTLREQRRREKHPQLR